MNTDGHGFLLPQENARNAKSLNRWLALMNRRLPIRSTSRIHTSALEWDYPFGGGPLGLPGGPSLFSGKRFNPYPSTRPSGPRHSLPSKIRIARFGCPGRNTERATGRATMSAICRPSELVRLSAITNRKGNAWPRPLLPSQIRRNSNSSSVSSRLPRASTMKCVSRPAYRFRRMSQPARILTTDEHRWARIYSTQRREGAKLLTRTRKLNSPKGQKKLAQGWSNATTLGNRPTNNSPFPPRTRRGPG